MKKACIISGGGSFGAFGAGTLARLNKDYDIVAGISTGALMAPLVALREWDTLKEGYTSVSQNDIIDRTPWYRPNPFTKTGKPNILAMIWAYLAKNKSIATSNALRKTIDKFILEEHYVKLLERNKDVIVGCQNLREVPSKVHYFNIKDSLFNDFKDWMWCSANAPLFTSLVDKRWTDKRGIEFNGTWTDGGLTELLALKVLRNMDIEEVDIIVHRQLFSHNYQSDKINNIEENASAIYKAMRDDIEYEKLPFIIKLLNDKGTTINVYYLPRKLSNNSLVFNKNQMTEWWNEGYETAFDEIRFKQYKAK